MRLNAVSQGNPIDYRVLREVRSYRDAESIVDILSDARFPVANTRIVGINLESVEQVMGRQTVLLAGGSGALSGASMGLFISLFFMIFSPVANLFSLLLFGLLVGAFFGAILGAVSHWMTRGRRDFRSVSGLQASAYEVQVRAEMLNNALAVLRQAGIAESSTPAPVTPTSTAGVQTPSSPVAVAPSTAYPTPAAQVSPPAAPSATPAAPPAAVPRQAPAPTVPPATQPPTAPSDSQSSDGLPNT
ncbi:general stress protein [Actinobaculum sp. 352]|uniref:general stress protein n=1 Tax=Actinobaculum sp. 352 TaxID=2490946 RepID=UPI0019D131D0|nr:general stress protein [Actinobaculum sp. 352]